MSKRKKENQTGQEAILDLTNIETAYLEIAARKLTANVDGVKQIITAAESILHRQMQTALAGSPHAQNQFLTRLESAERKQQEYQQYEITRGEKLKRHYQQQLDAAIKKAKLDRKSEEEIKTLKRDFIPHPDDIILRDDGYEIIGPTFDGNLECVREKMTTRERWLMQSYLDEYYPVSDEEASHTEFVLELCYEHFGGWSEGLLNYQRSSELLALMINQSLPNRFQFTGSDFVRLNWKHRHLKKRDLLKICYQNWKCERPKSFDSCVARDWSSPPVGRAILAFFRLKELVRRVQGEAKKLGNEASYEMRPQDIWSNAVDIFDLPPHELFKKNSGH